MAIDVTPAFLEALSTLSELGNTVEQAAVLLSVAYADLAGLLETDPAVRARWERGGLEAVNQLVVCLTKQALAGSVQAAKLLLEQRDTTAGKNAPIASAAPSTPEKTAPDPREWDTVPKVAATIGVVTRSLEKRCVAGEWPALEVKTLRGKRRVSAWAAYDHFNDYGSRQPGSLHTPPWPRPGEPVSTLPAVSVTDFPDGDLKNLDIETILRATLPGSSYEPQDKERLVKVVLALLRRQDSEERKLAKIAREDVIEMNRSLGELYCATIAADANARAAFILQTIREQLHEDLSQKNIGALDMLAAAECRFSNEHEIPKIKQAVLDNVDGVKMLEGMA